MDTLVVIVMDLMRFMGYGVGQRNFEGRMILELCLKKELCVPNTRFTRKEKRKVTFRLGENET